MATEAELRSADECRNAWCDPGMSLYELVYRLHGTAQRNGPPTTEIMRVLRSQEGEPKCFGN